MLKKLLFTFLVILVSFSLFSQNQTIKYTNLLQNEWLRVIQHNYTYFTVDKITQYTNYPSFIVTKSTDFTRNGYLHKVWVVSNTNINGVRNVQLTQVKILFWNGRQWVNSFYVDWIVVGNVSTQIHYFFYNYPVVEMQIHWENVKIQ